MTNNEKNMTMNELDNVSGGFFFCAPVIRVPICVPKPIVCKPIVCKPSPCKPRKGCW